MRLGENECGILLVVFAGYLDRPIKEEEVGAVCEALAHRFRVNPDCFKNAFPSFFVETDEGYLPLIQPSLLSRKAKETTNGNTALGEGLRKAFKMVEEVAHSFKG